MEETDLMSNPTHIDGQSLVEQPRLVDYMRVGDSLNWLWEMEQIDKKEKKTKKKT